MARPDLEAARLEALAALGKGGPGVLDALESAGLTVVRLADLPPNSAGRRSLRNVQLHAAENWQPPYPVTVVGEGAVLALHAQMGAVSLIREAMQLASVFGHRLTVEVDEAEGLLLRAEAVAQ